MGRKRDRDRGGDDEDDGGRRRRGGGRDDDLREGGRRRRESSTSPDRRDRCGLKECWQIWRCLSVALWVGYN